MNPDILTNPTVKAAIEALQSGERKARSELFEANAELYDDGAARSLTKLTQDAAPCIAPALSLILPIQRCAGLRSRFFSSLPEACRIRA